MKQLKCKFFKTLVKDRAAFQIRMGNEWWDPICGFSGDHKSYQCVDPLMAGWCANTSAMTAPSRFKSYFLIFFFKRRHIMVTYHIISWLQVCCPEFLGTFNNSVTRATEPVYAVSRWKHAQKQNTAKVTYHNSNQRHDRCEKQIGAGGLGGRWGLFLARGGVLPWEAHQVKKVQSIKAVMVFFWGLHWR